MVRFVVRRLSRWPVWCSRCRLLFFWLRALRVGACPRSSGRGPPSRDGGPEAALGLDQPVYVSTSGSCSERSRAIRGSTQVIPARTRSTSS